MKERKGKKRKEEAQNVSVTVSTEYTIKHVFFPKGSEKHKETLKYSSGHQQEQTNSLLSI